jgi:serine/threonine protein kinase
MTVKTATLMDGSTLEYVETTDPPSGTMKFVYFSLDHSYIIAFFHDQSVSRDTNRMKRLEAILTKFNPTVPKNSGGAAPNAKSADYFNGLFCWPTGIVTTPQFGIVAPTYPSDFFFSTGSFQGKEKNGKWFTSKKLRALLPEEENGDFLKYLSMCILLARAVRRLHQAGLAHSDLSNNNVLMDPISGRTIVIDIDSLVVPGLFPPDVLGTPGYIAPEVLATAHLSLDDPNRINPSAGTDQHALAVLIYEYLLVRHPLKGPKTYSAPTGEEQERMEMGANALFIENPADQSNKPADLGLTCDIFGREMYDLFIRSFVTGLHVPNKRPSALEWERALVNAWDRIHPCPNPGCTHKWFVVNTANTHNITCPFCHTPLNRPVPIIKFRKESRPGQWTPNGELIVYDGSSLFEWHVFDNIFPSEKANREPLAYCRFFQGKWILINQKLNALTSPAGNKVAPGKAVELTPGKQIRLSREPNGRMIEILMVG